MKKMFFIMFLIFSSRIVHGGSIEQLRKIPLTMDSFGPVKIGMTPAEASSALGWQLLFAPVGDTEPDPECDYVYPKGKYFGLGFMVENGHITRIDVQKDDFKTFNGISIGDSEKKVLNAFKNVKEEIHPYIGKDGKYLVIENKKGFGYVFETDNGIITQFRAGEIKSIKYIEGCL